MKKLNLFLCAAVCVAGFSLLGCGPKENWTTVEKFAPAAGTYAIKVETTSSVSTTSSVVKQTTKIEGSMTCVIKGTEDTSIVKQKDVSYTTELIMKFPSETSYNAAKQSFTDQTGYTFDDDNLTVIVKKSEDGEDGDMTYSEFCSTFSESENWTFESSSFGNWRITYKETDETEGTTTETTLTMTLQ